MIIQSHFLGTSGLNGFRGTVQMSLQHWQTLNINHHFGKPAQKITDTFILSPPKDDRTSFAQSHHITVDISVTGWAYSQFPSCNVSNFQAFSPDTFLHIPSLGSCPANSTGPQWPSHSRIRIFPECLLPQQWDHGWEGTGQQFALYVTHSQMPETGNTKQTRCPLKEKERNISRPSRKQKWIKEKNWEDLKLPLLSQLFWALDSV